MAGGESGCGRTPYFFRCWQIRQILMGRYILFRFMVFTSDVLHKLCYAI